MIGVIQRPRLYFIDGLRGIAALIVAVGHLIGMVGPDHPVVPIWNANLEMLIIWPWTFGGPAVWLFILLSGFALFWAEESRRLAGRGNTGLAAYIKRRFWRILPTYYMSLFLGVIVVVVMAPILIPPSPSLQTYSPTSWMGFIAHVFLFQNLDLGWRFQFVPPLWSISVEMQLYVILPLIFFMLRRINIWIISAFLLAVIYILNKVAPFPVFELIQWFLAGALMAYILRRRKITLTPALLCAGLGLGVGFARIPAIHGATEDLVWLLGIGGLVAALFRIEGLGRPETRVRPLMWLGARSYSLYAVHFPLGLLTWAVVGRLDLASSVSTLCVVTAGLAVSLLASSLSYKFVERPSLEMARGRPAWGPAGAPKGASGTIQKNG